MLVALILAPATVHGQDRSDGQVDRLEKAIADGNVGGVIRYAARRLDVSILNDGKNYSRSQAEFVLDQFFAAHPATDFRFTDSSESGRGRFVEGLYYSSESRQPFRVYIRLKKQDNDSWELRAFTVEKQR